MALVAEVGVDRLGLLTHDVGDTVGGELLARNLEGDWPVEITGRVLTNGSIYMRWARLSDGQRFLLDLPDRRLADRIGAGQGHGGGRHHRHVQPRDRRSTTRSSAPSGR